MNSLMGRTVGRWALRFGWPAVAFLIMFNGAPAAGLIMLGVGVVAYFFGLMARPLISCWACGGGQTSAKRGRSFRWCPVCKAKGFFVKWGVRVLQPRRAHRIADEIGLSRERVESRHLVG